LTQGIFAENIVSAFSRITKSNENKLEKGENFWLSFLQFVTSRYANGERLQDFKIFASQLGHTREKITPEYLIMSYGNVYLKLFLADIYPYVRFLNRIL
jgi:hypothetical protein